uniref:Uncharacterized protein n=1 Tax=Anguilla anguilla TaxID=7936 RepID=A0A0E9RSJ7_ANGAN
MYQGHGERNIRIWIC